MIKVGVIFGGETVEHEVSVISAVQAMNKMDNEKYEIIPIYITKDREWYTGEVLKDIETYQDINMLKRYCKNVVLFCRKGAFVLQSKGLFASVVKEIDIAFPIVHGTNVEDGSLQGYLRSIGIPFVGSDVMAASIGQDKVIQKQVWKNFDLPMTKYVWFYDTEYKEDNKAVIKKVNSLNYPVIVKPATLGSSVGISVAKKETDLIKAIDDAISYDTKVVVEEVVENLTEVNIAVFGNYESQSLSEIEQVMSDNDLLTYEDKYVGKSKKTQTASKGMVSAFRKIPADVPEKIKEEVREVALTAFKSLNISGNVRIDFLVDQKKKKVYINEVNTCPGSLAFYLWDAVGKKYTDLLDDMINLGIKEYKKRTSKTHSFDTNILKGYSELRGRKGKLK